MRRLLMLAVMSVVALGCSGSAGATDAGGDAGRSLDGGADGGADGGSDAGASDGGADGGFIDGGADAGTPDGGPPPCMGLGVAACRARADCAADFCVGCTCTPAFVGCRRAQDPAFRCPIVDCVQPPCCVDTLDCVAGSAVCVAPGEAFHRCGVCDPQPGTCTTDTDCQGAGPKRICEPITCTCAGEKVCVPGCATSGACAEGTTCSSSSGRCEATACASSADCPSLFTCSAGACSRKTCTADAACDDGFCVEGRCYGAWGRCELLAP
jgi:hypothetical protein